MIADKSNSSPPSPATLAKQERLREICAALDRVIVAFSGGVDSSYVARIAKETLGERARAVTARSPSLSADELASTIAIANEIGIRHEFIDAHEMERPGYVENSPNRCYHCKSELYSLTARLAEDGSVVLDGLNADDLTDHRPGRKAADEREVRHPLAEVGLTKAEIRSLSFALGLSTWNKPQLACLASRIPYGTSVTPERLSKVEQVEGALRRLGFHDVRARLVAGAEDIVRIEVGLEELPELLKEPARSAVTEAGRRAGFQFVTVDLEGFRTGRMNEALPGRMNEALPGRMRVIT